jgi:hypothetical protein
MRLLEKNKAAKDRHNHALIQSSNLPFLALDA